MVAISNEVRDKLYIYLNALNFVGIEICVYFIFILSLTLLKLGIPNYGI